MRNQLKNGLRKSNKNESRLKEHYKMFYNNQTKQIHRFLPLFEKKWDGLIMGVCMDSCKVSVIRNDSDKSINNDGYVPSIRKGQFVIVCKTEFNRVKLTYKNENLFHLKEVCDNHLQNLVFTNLGFGWKDYIDDN